jgi:hypothetical protein
MYPLAEVIDLSKRGRTGALDDGPLTSDDDLFVPNDPTSGFGDEDGAGNV